MTRMFCYYANVESRPVYRTDCTKKHCIQLKIIEDFLLLLPLNLADKSLLSQVSSDQRDYTVQVIN